jgi:hypothetical protein
LPASTATPIGSLPAIAPFSAIVIVSLKLETPIQHKPAAMPQRGGELDRIPIRSKHLESWPGLSRPSTSSLQNRRKQDVDARDKRGHDAESVIRPDRNPV